MQNPPKSYAWGPCFENTNRPLSKELIPRHSRKAETCGIVPLWWPDGYHRPLGYSTAIPSPCSHHLPLFTHPSSMEGPNPGVDVLGAVANLNDDLWIIVDPSRPGRTSQKLGRASPSALRPGAPQRRPAAVVQIKDVGLRWT